MPVGLAWNAGSSAICAVAYRAATKQYDGLLPLFPLRGTCIGSYLLGRCFIVWDLEIIVSGCPRDNDFLKNACMHACVVYANANLTVIVNTSPWSRSSNLIDQSIIHNYPFSSLLEDQLGSGTAVLSPMGAYNHRSRKPTLLWGTAQWPQLSVEIHWKRKFSLQVSVKLTIQLGENHTWI